MKGIFIPIFILKDKDLTLSQKLILSEIYALSNGRPCTASNAHFNEVLGFNKANCSRLVKSLEAKDRLKIQLFREKHIVVRREIVPNRGYYQNDNNPSKGYYQNDNKGTVKMITGYCKNDNRVLSKRQREITQEITEEKREAPAPEEDQTNQYTGGGSIAIEYQVKSLFIKAGAVCLDSDIRHCKTIAYAMRDIIKQSKPNGGRPSNDQIKEGIKAVFDNLPEWVKDKGFFSPSGIARNISGIVNEIRANKAAKLKDKAKKVSIHYSPAKRPKKQP